MPKIRTPFVFLRLMQPSHTGMHGGTFRSFGQNPIFAEFRHTGARSAHEQVRSRAVPVRGESSKRTFEFHVCRLRVGGTFGSFQLLALIQESAFCIFHGQTATHWLSTLWSLYAPEVERWLYQWLSTEPLRRADFFETATGNCRLMSHLCARLSETAPTWRKLVAPWAEYVARTLWATTSPSKERRLSTPLTQQHRRTAKGRPSFAEVKTPKPERLCRGCGKTVQGDSTNCSECDVAIATKRLVEVAKAGRLAGHTPEALAKEAATHRRHAQAKAAWNPAKQPSWLTEQVFSERIQPVLAQASATVIAKRIGVSRWYAGRIREGYTPHPRHWQALARIVGIESG